MDLPECNSTHWKSKFIDGLPTLFAERVRKTLRGKIHSINYDDYTYGKLISACVQEGLSLCNEIKLNQQIKRHRLNERQQLGEFCEQFALDIPKASSKDKKHSSKNKSSKMDYEEWKKSRIAKKERGAEPYKEMKRSYKKISTDRSVLLNMPLQVLAILAIINESFYYLGPPYTPSWLTGNLTDSCDSLSLTSLDHIYLTLVLLFKLSQ
uniref:Uncharacterized protein n=1 Tax=Solanum tuberosum TaxID=4113 RepID=M1B010_SOLTU